jgi:hypothetical protein
VRTVALAIVVVIAAWPCRVLAAGHAAILVARGPGTERCPDADALDARVAAILGRPTADMHTSYEVSFSRSGGIVSATIRRNDATEQARVIPSRADSCETLTQATAVTLALLFDADRQKEATAAVTTAPVAEHRAEQPVTLQRPSLDAALSLGAGAVAGVVSPIAGAILGEAGIDVDRWRAGIGALWIAPQTMGLGVGNVRESLWGLTARICYVFAPRAPLHFDLCSGAIVAIITGQASGYSENENGAEPWVGFPAEIGIFGGSALARFELSAAGIVPIRPDEFSITGTGVAYRAPPVGAMLTLRVAGLVRW